MKTNKRIFIISVAIVAVIALTLGISFAAWDSGTAKDDYVVVTGSNAELKVNSALVDTDKVLVPKDQIGLGIANTNKVSSKTLANITITLNDDAEGGDLAVVYAITAIYSVPKGTSKSLAEIKEMDPGALKTAEIIDLNVAHNSNPRYLTGDEEFNSSKPEGTDLRINLIDASDASNGTKNYKAGDEIPFNTAGPTPTTSTLTLSMEFLRTATEDFVTKNDFLNRDIMIEITFSLKVKETSTPANI